MSKSFSPPHIYREQTVYFLTAHTRDNIDILITDSHKKIFMDILDETVDIFRYKLYGWTININHYHLLIYVSSDLCTFIQKLHGKSSFLFNKFDRTSGRKVWANYWDRCIRYEEDFYRRLNYIHHNAVKHGYVKAMGDYIWSSYNIYKEKYGQEWLADCFEKYSIIDFTTEGPD